MAGGYYTALSGMRTRMEALDRVASDISNASTAGYKAARGTTEQADRPSFGAALKSAIDVTSAGDRTDFRPGALTTTNAPMDVAIEGRGFFSVQSDHGTRYTRNGHFQRRADGVLSTDEGDAVLGVEGPIKIGQGLIEIDADGTVREGKAAVGALALVDFPPGATLERDGGSRFRTVATPEPIAKPSISAGSLEQSNVSLVDRVAELSEVSRNYQTLLKAVSILMNDVDRGAITELGRR
ncbi:MAG: flagellar hook basal-body protein [Vicinamibacterales bacterium]